MAGEVQTPHAVVTVDGSSRRVKSVSLTREIATDLPGEVAGGGGMVAATGTVEWADDVSGLATGRVATPKPLQAVTVAAGVDGASGGLSRRFTGVVDKTGGRASSIQASSALVDRSRSLDRPVTVPVHLAQEVSDFGDVTNTGLSSMWMVHEVARQAGWPAYHYTGRNVLWASLAGSILPARTPVGSFTTLSTGDPVDIVPVITPDEGVGLSLAPDTRLAWPLPPPAASGGQAVEVSIWCDPAQSSIFRFELFNKTSAGAQDGWIVQVTGGSVMAYRRTDPVVVASVAGSGWQPVTLHVSWTSAGWYVRVWTRSGFTDSGLIPDTGAAALAASDGWELFTRTGADSVGNATVAGVVVDRITDRTPRGSELTYSAPLRVRTTLADIQSWSASRLIENTPGIDVLRGLASAECAGLWVDEDGVLQWMSRSYMRARPLGASFYSRDRLLDYSWQDTLDSNRSTVTVKHLMPAYSVRVGWNLTVWSADGDTRYKRGEKNEQFVEPDGLEDWWQPDFDLDMGDPTAKPTNGSWWGGRVRTDSTDAIVRTAGSGDGTAALSKIGPQKAKLTVAASSAIAANQYLDTTGTPVVRARGRAVWTEQAYTSTVLGPLDAPALEHDTGWYVQWTGPRQRLADWLATNTNGTFPTVEGIEVVPDPTVRLGDKVTIRDEHVKGYRFDGVVFRIEESWADGAASMTLGLRVTAFSPGLAATLAELDARWAGKTLAQFDAGQGGRNLAAFDADPLA